MKVAMLDCVRHTLFSGTLILLLGDYVLLTSQSTCLGLGVPRDGSALAKLGWREGHWLMEVSPGALFSHFCHLSERHMGVVPFTCCCL